MKKQVVKTIMLAAIASLGISSRAGRHRSAPLFFALPWTESRRSFLWGIDL